MTPPAPVPPPNEAAWIHRSDCPARFFTDHPERCRCTIMQQIFGDDPNPPQTVFERFPDAFDERQRPVCGVWNPLLGPCVCGNPDGHPAPSTTEPGDER